MSFYHSLARRYPELKLKLEQARMEQKPEDLVKQSFQGAIYMTAGIVFFIFVVFSKLDIGSPLLFLGYPLLLMMAFGYLMKLPDARISKIEKEISKEIVFAGRFLSIELESGVPLYTALKNLGKNYPALGTYTDEIINKVNLGTDLEEAMNESIELTPSDDFRKLMWQIINSLSTGSDVSKSLGAITDQIAKRQAIEVNRYGKKLNPMAMFYMMIAVIAPSLGMTMLIILSSFVNFTLGLPILISIAFFIGFIQFMFLSMIKFSRPPIEF